MKARILYYNKSTGEGKLIDEKGVKHAFHADSWDDFKTMPMPGMVVSCRVAGNKIDSLVPATASSAKEKQEDVAEETSPQKVLEKAPSASIPHDGHSSLGIEECLKNYFEPIDFLIGSPPKIVKTDEYLDFFKIRRFLLTAFNDLQEIDPHIRMDTDLKERFMVLQNLYKAYKNTEHNISNAGLAFELVFLRNQPEYLQHIRKKEECLTRISAMGEIEESIYPEIRDRENRLKQLKYADHEERKKLETELKKMKKSYVDAIHEGASLSEEVRSMQDLKAVYTKRYYDDFVKHFEKKAEYYLKIMERILGYKAYAFDRFLWHKASRSKAIREHFSESHIDGEFSTLTFLKYYLNTLDVDKLSEEQKELFDLLAYLEYRREQAEIK